MNQPSADRCYPAPQTKPMKRKGLSSDSSRNEWLQVDLVEFLATTVDLRILLFHSEEASILAT